MSSIAIVAALLIVSAWDGESSGGRQLMPDGQMVDVELIEVAPDELRSVAERPDGGFPTDSADTHVEDLLSAAGVVPVIVVSTVPLPDMTALRLAADPTERRLLREILLDENAAVIAALRAELEAVGAAEIQFSWLTSSFRASLPAAAAAGILGLASVFDVFLDVEAGFADDVGYTGKQFKDALNVGPFHSNGYSGQTGNRISAGSPIEVAVIESSTSILTGHPGWLDSAGGSNRIVKRESCSSSGCSPTGAPSGETHGLSVTWALAGSIQQGQDSSYPGSNTTAQQERSGVAKEVRVEYFISNGSAGHVEAIEEAVLDGVDIITQSFSYDSWCNKTTNFSNLNSAFRQAVDAGVMVFSSAGNDGSEVSGCSLRYPSYRPEVMGVSGMDTGGLFPPDWDDTVLHANSSRGPMDIVVQGMDRPDAWAGLMVSAPYNVTSWFAGNSGYHDWVNDGLNGTSYSTPIAAGGAARMKDALVDLGVLSANSNGWLWMANVALQGDRWIGPASGTRSGTGIGGSAGYGRMKLRAPEADTLPSPRGWGVVAAWNRTNGTSIRAGIGQIPTGVSRFKVVALWDETSLNDAADVIITLEDGCSGSGPFPVIAADASYNLRKKIATSGASVAGKCIRLRIDTDYVPAGKDVDVYVAWYYQGGSDVDL